MEDQRHFSCEIQDCVLAIKTALQYRGNQIQTLSDPK